eukprot:scaffold15034_cov181-Amphora_coffeaeformis.AAC.2
MDGLWIHRTQNNTAEKLCASMSPSRIYCGDLLWSTVDVIVTPTTGPTRGDPGSLRPAGPWCRPSATSASTNSPSPPRTR